MKLKLSIILILLFNVLLSQEKKIIQIIEAGSFDKNELDLPGANILKKNSSVRVHLLHDGMDIWSDYALFYKKNNSFKARGDVVVKQGDSIELYSENLEYDGNSRKIIAKTNVIFKNNNTTLKTQILFHDRDLKEIYFENGGIIDLYRNYYGLGSRLTYTDKKENWRHRWQIGTETALQRDQRDRFLNQSGIQGANVFSQEERFGSLGFYILDELQSKKWLLRTSLRFDHQNLGTDKGVDNQNYTVLNPSVGLSYAVVNQQHLFFNFSTSFETPALSELSANPSGEEGLNLDLDPSRAINYEAGWKALGAITRFEATVFYIKSSNEILPYELEAFPGRSFYQNSGATQRYGVELFGEARWNQWKLQASLTQASFQFDAETYDSSELEGNRLPGIPNSQAFLQLEYITMNKWQFQLTGEHIGNLYANSNNTVKVEGYQRFRIQARKGIDFSWGQMDFFTGIHNLLNATYFDNIRLNAFGSRHYEPAPGRNFFGGISFGF